MRWAYTICLTASLAACAAGAGDAMGTAARELAGAVAGWSEGEPASLVAELFDGADMQTIAEGDVGPAGSVQLILPDELAGAFLSSLGDLVPCAEVTVTPEHAQGALLFSLTVLRDGHVQGAIAQASSQAATFPAPSEVGAFRIFRLYADRDATAVGRCESSAPGSSFAHAYELDLQRGWNLVVETIVELTEGSEVRESRTAPLPPSGFDWHFLDAMMLPE